MKRLIDLYYFRGWTKKEKREYILSLILTIAFCAGLVYAASLAESAIRQDAIRNETKSHNTLGD